MIAGEVSVEEVIAAHGRLTTHLQTLLDAGLIDDAFVRGRSLLAGWSRDHTLGHLACHADSVVRALDGAMRGEVAPRYPGPPGTRDQQIVERSRRSAAQLVSDVSESSAVLERRFAEMTTAAWRGSCGGPGGEQPVIDLVSLRLREVELHHLDLDLPGFTASDFSDAFVRSEGVRQGDPNADRTRVAVLNGRPGEDPAAWTAATLDPRWRRSFTSYELDAFDAGLAAYRRHGRGLELTPDSGRWFALDDRLRQLVAELASTLIDGPGVAALEGFPVERYSKEELRVIWWGLCSALGTPRSQSHRGDLIGDVRDLGTGIAGSTGRGYTSNSELNFHADVVDVAGLFFLATAREGGVSRLASSVATHDRLAARRPDLLAELYRPMPCSWQGNQPDGDVGWYPMPVFGRAGGRASCAYVRTNILLASKNAGAPPLTDRQVEAVESVRQTASEPDMWVEHSFDPGAMLFAHNHTVLHLRTAFVDWDEPDRKRHLLRTWLSMSSNRELPATFASFFGDVQRGALRGGYQSRSGDLIFATDT